MEKQLEHQIKELIISTLKLEDITPEEIDSEKPLFRDGLGLDSIDALEIGIAIQKKYGIKFDAQDEQVQHHFSSVSNLAAFIAASTKEV